MADVITRLKLESGEYDSKIKRATQGLLQMEQEYRKVGGTLAVLEKDQLDYVRSLGNMETVSRNARGRLSELTAAFTEWSMLFKRLTDEEKKSDFGKALNSSLSQLKTRINESKQQLADVSKELGETGVNMGKLGAEGLDLKSAMSTLGGQLGINTSLITGLSAGTMGAVAAIGALIAAEVKAAQAFAEYNEEIGKQSQVTTVTTGLSGGDAERMTTAARSLAKVYDTDFREVINAANTLMTQFGKSGDEAIELIRDGMQGMIMGDGGKLLSMIQQYAPSFRDAGIEASQLVAIIQNSEGGIFTDQNMNAIVMGIRNIRLMTKQTSEALAQLGIDGQKMSKQLNDGTLTIFDALQQVAGAIESVDSNSQSAGEVMQYVFGRQGTMAGTNLGKAIATLNINLEETKRQTGGVGQATAELEQATERLDKAIRNCFGYDGWLVMTNGIKTDLTNAMADFLNVVNKVDHVLESISGKGVFEHMFDTMIRALGPLGIVADNLKDILKYTHAADLLKLQFGDEGTSTPSTSKLPNLSNAGAWGTTLNRLVPQTSTIANRPESVPTSAAPSIKPIKTDTANNATPQESAADKVSEAERTYAETLLKNSIRLEAGLDSTLDNKKKELSAQERLFDAYNDAYATYEDPAYKEASQQAAERIKQLAEEVKTLTDTHEASKQAARELEAAQKKLADAQQKLADAQDTGSATAIYKAQQEVERQRTAVTVASGNIPTGYQATLTINVDTQEVMDAVQRIEGLVIDPKTLTVTASTQEALDALREVDGMTIDPKTVKVTPVPDDTTQTMFDGLRQSVQAEIKFDQMRVDENTLHSLLQTALQNGFDGLTVDYSGLQERIAQGIDIPDSTWEALQEEINTKLEELGIEPITIDFNTGNIEKVEEDGESLAKSWNSASKAVGSIGSALQSIEDPTAKVAGLVAQAVAQIAATFAASLKGTFTPWDWIAGAAAGTATMISTISAIKSATKGGFAEGGIVPGNSFSGDNLRISDYGINSGELILSRAQQDTIASALEQSDENALGGTPYVLGETIFIGLTNYLRRTGRGELITANR